MEDRDRGVLGFKISLVRVRFTVGQHQTIGAKGIRPLKQVAVGVLFRSQGRIRQQYRNVALGGEARSRQRQPCNRGFKAVTKALAIHFRGCVLRALMATIYPACQRQAIQVRTVGNLCFKTRRGLF